MRTASPGEEPGALKFIWLEFSEAEWVDVVATDGNRFARARAAIEPPGAPEAVGITVGLPTASVPLINSYLQAVEHGTVTLSLDNPEFVGWIAGPLRLMTPRGEEGPPPWRIRLLKERVGSVMFSKAYLHQAVGSVRGDAVLVTLPRADGEPLVVEGMEPGTTEWYVMPMKTNREGVLNQLPPTAEAATPDELRDLV